MNAMRIDLLNKAFDAVMTIILFGFMPYSVAQEKPADNMQILRDKIKADKKLVVATNMELTESEAKGVWPIYDQYQKDLQKINQRIATGDGRAAGAVGEASGLGGNTRDDCSENSNLISVFTEEETR